MKRTACVLTVRGDGAVLAVSRPDPPIRFSLPGGHIEGGESRAEAAARELFEETGYLPTSLHLLHESVSNKTRVSTFIAPSVVGELRSSDEGLACWVDVRVLVCPGAAYPRHAREVFAAAGAPPIRC